MGYRSDITAIFYSHKPEDYAAIKLWVQENILNLEIVKECADVAFHEDRDTIEVSFQAIKWYDNYIGVQAFENATVRFQELFDAEDSVVRGAFEMAVVGEDLADVTHAASASAEYYLYIRREIEFC